MKYIDFYAFIIILVDGNDSTLKSLNAAFLIVDRF